MSLKKQLSLSVTLLNLTFGFVAMILAINKNYSLAAISILIAVVMDVLDGKVARYFKAVSELGAELDSLSDLVSFGVAPAVLMYVLFQNKLLAFFLIIFVLCGAFRLARFNIFKTQVKGFVGMPITVNGLIFPALYFAGATFYVVLIIVIASSILMISTMRFRKVV